MLIWNSEDKDRPLKPDHKAETASIWKKLLLTQTVPQWQLEKDSPFSLTKELQARRTAWWAEIGLGPRPHLLAKGNNLHATWVALSWYHCCSLCLLEVQIVWTIPCQASGQMPSLSQEKRPEVKTKGLLSINAYELAIGTCPKPCSIWKGNAEFPIAHFNPLHMPNWQQSIWPKGKERTTYLTPGDYPFHVKTEDLHSQRNTPRMVLSVLFLACMHHLFPWLLQ